MSGSVQWIVASVIFSVAMIITAKICHSTVDRSISSDGNNRFQMQIITDKGANWNGIYVLDKRTGRMRFYSSSSSFEKE